MAMGLGTGASYGGLELPMAMGLRMLGHCGGLMLLVSILCQLVKLGTRGKHGSLLIEDVIYCMGNLLGG